MIELDRMDLALGVLVIAMLSAFAGLVIGERVGRWRERQRRRDWAYESDITFNLDGRPVVSRHGRN